MTNFIKYLSFFIMILFLSCEKILGPSGNFCWYLQHKFDGNITYYSIDFPDKKNGWVVGQSGVIKYTSNGGRSWIDQESEVSADLWEVCFVDAKNGWICGAHNTILKTNNGGKSWKNFLPASEIDVLFTSIKFIDIQTGWVSGNKGEVLKTVDGGLNWEVKKRFRSSGGSYLAVFNENITYLYKGYFYRTFDGGQTWDSLLVSKPQNYIISNIFFVNEKNGYLTTGNGTGGTIINEFPVLVTQDSCVTWHCSDYLLDGGIDCAYFIDENNGWAAGNQNVYRTKNGGMNWSLDFSPDDGDLRAKDICFVNPGCGWIITRNGEIYKFHSSGG